jgi:hypothetical protein
MPVFEFQGKVINGFDNEPVGNINVCALDRRSNKVYNSSVTDSEGMFSISLKENQFNYFNTVIIDEPGFAKVSQIIHKNNLFVTIVLQQSGHFTGTVTKEDGTPIPEIIVKASTVIERPNKSKQKQNIYKSLPTDYYGNYFISNVVAPANYDFNISNPNYVLNSITNYCSAEPNETVDHNLTVMAATVLAFKAFDERIQPLLNYKLKYYNIYKDAGDVCIPPEFSINLKDDKWFYQKLGTFGNGDIIFLQANNYENALSYKTNNISFAGQITNYINLYLEKSEKNITGYLLKSNGQPMKRTIVFGKTKKSYVRCKTDKFGYFEFNNVKVENNQLIKVSAGSHKWGKLQTNLLIDSKDVELKLN